MRSPWNVVLALSCFTFPSISHPTGGKRQLSCIDVVIPVTISATNLQIPIASTGPEFNVPVRGTFNIAARYCEPEIKIPFKQHTLQILVHGITYDRNYWSGDGPPGSSYHGDQYSWIAFASKQGYPTLSIDRLGNGLSDHPDPITVVQLATHVETIHQLVLKARSGTLPGPSKPRAFNKVIYAGHSFGSGIGNGLNAKYPSDIDATILTGFTNAINEPVLSEVTTTDFSPAAQVNAEKFGNLDPGYIAINNETTFTQLFYYPGGFDTALAALDYSLRGTVTTGEIISISLGPVIAPGYTRPVFVITGQHDGIFCDLANPDPPVNVTFATFDCGPHKTGLLAQTKALYPAAKFKWYAPPSAGHCWHFHREAYATFSIAHKWLATQGL
ncbi:Ff.00g101260.m01.CDS01 [Fusarium sp. VM40]|nr:Ff.00g101260.m01.CDS01 [Fusarium sp. VM40]